MSPPYDVSGMMSPMDESESDGRRETAYLLRSPAKASRLPAAVARDRAGGETADATPDGSSEAAEP
ncbi:type II toxin-antitoxin system Phd/YefM family antitoxin [Nocardiopsis protaetiae]|uniref:hypothetical protein n=2 Tax=Nocardiopsis protaetiae TaxID=3382270 RepID=UPI00387AA369